MKIRTDNAILRFIGMGLGLIFLGVTLYLYFQLEFIGAWLIFSGLITLIIGIYASTKTVGYLRDERIAKNMDKAGHHAFWLVLIVITTFNMTEVIFSYSLKYHDVSTVIMFVGIYSFLILRWYYNKKGEA